MPPFTLDHFPAPRPRFTDAVSVVAEPGTRDALKRAAEASGQTVPDLVRHALRLVVAEISPAPSSAREAA